MLPVSPVPFTGYSTQAARPAAEPPAAPAPAPLSAPVAVAKVELASAVRPPDALLRAFRPDLLPKADADTPTGPPPAFAANMLDLLPDSMTPPEDPALAADAPQAGEEGTTAAVGAPDPQLADAATEQVVASADRPAYG